MADAAAAEDSKAPAPAAPGVSMKMLIIIVAATLLLGLGGAFAIFKLTAGGHAAEEGKALASAAKGEGHGEAKVSSPGAVFDVEPFIVNLSDVQEVRYLKITVKLELDTQDAAAELTSRMSQIRDAILVLLTSKDSATIRSTQGKFQLRDEITQRINSLLPRPAVRTVYFTDFVVQ